MKKEMAIIIGLLILGIFILAGLFGYNFNKAYIRQVRTNTVNHENYLDESFENITK